jgi:hypothetical protein
MEQIIKSFRISDISNLANTVNNSEEFKKTAISSLVISSDRKWENGQRPKPSAPP